MISITAAAQHLSNPEEISQSIWVRKISRGRDRPKTETNLLNSICSNKVTTLLPLPLVPCGTRSFGRPCWNVNSCMPTNKTKKERNVLIIAVSCLLWCLVALQKAIAIPCNLKFHQSFLFVWACTRFAAMRPSLKVAVTPWNPDSKVQGPKQPWNLATLMTSSTEAQKAKDILHGRWRLIRSLAPNRTWDLEMQSLAPAAKA